MCMLQQKFLGFAYSNALARVPFHILRYVGVIWLVFLCSPSFTRKIYPTTLVSH
jgi:hypothetical protein